MTDDRRPADTEAEPRATLAALYRLLEDAQRYEEYAEVAQRAYDEETLTSSGSCARSPADGPSVPRSCSRSGWPTAGYTSQPIRPCGGPAQF